VNKRCFFLFVFALVCSFYCHKVWGAGYTELAGDLPKFISSEKSPYIVISDIYVSAGKTVRIEPGVTFLFKNFTGLHVSGILQLNGTDKEPVIFTSENDYTANHQSNRNPTPYDWNGIYIHKDGFGTDLKNFQIKYSVKGIISETKYIRIINGMFLENGRSNLTIEGAEKQVFAGEYFNYDLSINDAKIDGIPLNILKDPLAPKRNISRYCGLAFLAGGATTGVIYSLKLRASAQDLANVSNADDKEMMTNHNSKDWNAAHQKRNRDLAGTISSFAVSLAGAVVFVWTFTF